MRTLTVLGAAAVGAVAGWRAARSHLVGLLAPQPVPGRRRAGADRAPAALEALRDTELPGAAAQAMEKLVALLELGRERGLVVVQNALGGRTGHAA